MTDPYQSEIWQHRKSGGLYTIIGECLIEASMTPAVIYKSLFGGQVWVRPKEEFHDGRFVNIGLDEIAR